MLYHHRNLYELLSVHNPSLNYIYEINRDCRTGHISTLYLTPHANINNQFTQITASSLL